MAYYTQLRERDRIGIYRGLTTGLTQSMIAAQLDRNKSSISREIRRNSDHIGYLSPRDAHDKTRSRKARHGSKIDRNPALKSYILARLHNGWSPGIIAGCWKKNNQKNSISAEAIYQFIYHETNCHLALWKLLPRTKKKRGVTRKQHSKGKIQGMVPIHQRPKEIETRTTVGHYEGDLMFNQGSKSANILTIVERKSRMVTLVKHETKHSNPIIESVEKKIGDHAESVTFDQGAEFAFHHKLSMPVFFCNPASPWQKGSVENMNGLLRRYLPFSMKPQDITQEYLDQVAHIMNSKPRKILGFLTPLEVFNREQKKLKSESRVKPALPAAEVSYQNNSTVALHY
jgi:IS30 family transposase